MTLTLSSNALRRMTRNEAVTRLQLIDPQLAESGWLIGDRSQVALEIPVDGYDAEPWNGVTDYCLFRSNGEVLTVVEAKRQSRSPQRARDRFPQMKRYSACLMGITTSQI